MDCLQDRQENGRLSYRLVSEASSEIVSIDESHGKITVRKSIDFEEIQFFQLAIEDVNDNAPEFLCTTWHAVLPVNSSPATSVITVKAIDRDSRTFGTVFYAILDTVAEFSIDRSNGAIKTTKSLSKGEYTIRVGATDGYGMASKNNATVTIFITENTNIPSSLAISSKILTIDRQHRLRITSTLPTELNYFSELLIANSDTVSISKCIEVRVFHNPPPPLFKRRSVSLTIKRNTPIGEKLIKIDAGVKCNFTIDCRWFRVLPEGTVILSQIIDKSINGLQCTIEANDSKQRKDYSKLLITVLDEEMPLPLEATYNLHMKRNAKVGSILIKLVNSTNYLFTSRLETPIGVFPDSTVYLKKPIDNYAINVISFPVVATHRTCNNSYFTTVRVFIDDVNCWIPRCSRRRSFCVDENVGVGTMIGYLNATDDDVGIGGVIGYRLLNNRDRIRIHIATGEIRSAAVFDAEILQGFEFSYELFDYGSPRRAVICRASITIVDMNDNIPRFERFVYTVKVDVGNSSTDRRLITVKAIDKDRTSTLTYKLLNYFHLFEIDAISGTVSRKGPLRPNSRFNISIAVHDDDRRRMAKTILIVTTNSNKNLPPVFDRMIPFRLPQNVKIGSVIGKVRAISGSYTIQYHSSDSRFDIDTWGNVILVDQPMSSGSFDFVVTASTTFTNSTLLQKVDVTESPNDIEEKIFRIQENSAPIGITQLPAGFDILVTAPSSSAFTISDNELKLVTPLSSDYSPTYYILVGEKRTSTLLTVEIERITKSNTTCEEVVIIIDVIPFTTMVECILTDSRGDEQLRYRMMSSSSTVTSDGKLIISSHEALQDVVTTIYVDVFSEKISTTLPLKLIRGTSLDCGIVFQNEEISMLSVSQPMENRLRIIYAESTLPLRFYITGSSCLQIDENTGTVSIRRKCSRYETTTVVAVTDNGIAMMKLNVEFIDGFFSNRKSTFLFVPQVLSAGQLLERIDIDNVDVVLQISDPYIYNHGKNLYLKKHLDLRDMYLLRSMKDRHVENEHIEFWIRENAPYGSVVGQIPNSMRGVDATNLTSYSIINSDNLSIDKKTGVITTTSSFDHEVQQLYTFTIRTTYSSGHYIDRKALLVIDDENDNVPQYANDSYHIQISEDVFVGFEILQLKWTDQDFNNAFHFAIVEGNELGYFRVDNDGRITVIHPLDREHTMTHYLVVQLSDGIAPYPYHTIDCVVTVDVLDINDNHPIFISPTEYQVEENSPMRKIIGKIKAVDADEGRNSMVSYRIMPESLPKAEFIIDAVNGDIIVSSIIVSK
ncbi:cadherin domain protein [Dictyocaulus viviparus]|uniref:Cadherin domain protein n=1 Tax=Dictyocaulus viviparus TaxID=29172 RepID=A0A0D8X7C0_DICVI|nr:cadherin domain protein [Dictyocaulus viviparus]